MAQPENGSAPRILAVPFPSPGHINPMTQLCKRLVTKGLKATLALTIVSSKKYWGGSELVQVETISDGDDELDLFVRYGMAGMRDSIARFTEHGSESLSRIISKYESLGDPITCVIYDSLLPWVVEVSKKFGLVSVALFTQPSCVNITSHHLFHKLLKHPFVDFPISIPGLPLLDRDDAPAYPSHEDGAYNILGQFCTVDKADFVFLNTFSELDGEALEVMLKFCPMMTVGPTIPSFYLDKIIENDMGYGLSLPQDHSGCINWLNSKPAGSVVYVSLSSVSFASPSAEQVEQLAFGLKDSGYNFLWIVKDFEVEKLPKNFAQETSDKGLILQWCAQLEVLSNKAVGCMLSHCGWNSVIEAISNGVPIVAMPMWGDQPTNAKFIEDVWKVGIRLKRDENGIIGREQIQGCIRELMEGSKGAEIKANCVKFKALAKEAVSEGGSSDQNLNKLVSKLKNSS